MSSRLPKPSGLKPPQIRALEPLSEIVTNKNFQFKPRVHEAPPGTSRPIPATRLKRRSKSVTDLAMKPSLFEFKASVQSKNVNNKIVNKTAPTAAPLKANASKPLKRPGGNNEEAPKPKVSKKIPDWDYKSRFNQLNERYQRAQENIESMKLKVTQFDEIQTNFVKAQEENKNLNKIKISLQAKCEGYDHISSELSDLKSRHEALENEHRALEEKFNNLEKEYESNHKEAERINNCYEELQKAHEKLSDDYKALTRKYEEITRKHELYLKENKDLLADVNNKKLEIEKLNKIVSVQKEDLLEFETERRVLHNIIQDLKGNIRVFCRVRPPLPSEADKLECCIHFPDESSLEIRKSRESISQITGRTQDIKSEFTFDKVFCPQNLQEELFEDLAQLVQSALDGYDICVFAYGQTGSGKTYTMQGGDGPQRGMIPRTIQLIFEKIKHLKRCGWDYSVQASFLEIYNENIRDLLNINNGQKMEIYFNEGKGTTVTNLTIQQIDSAVELEKYMRLAHSNRATAATNFNEHSSRSHAVTKIYLQGSREDQNIIYRGSINLVDLAGSESAKQSVVGDRLTETKNINRSLATLGDVICALHNKSKHIPYRNSKLTYLLQSSLGGNSKTLMIVNIAPFEECFGESISSLRFASKVKEVKTGIKRNKIM